MRKYPFPCDHCRNPTPHTVCCCYRPAVEGVPVEVIDPASDENVVGSLAPNGRPSEGVPAVTLTKAEWRALPRASYPEIDAYMASARAFVTACTLGHREVAQATATTVAEYMAFLDGKRVSGPLEFPKGEE